MPVEFSVAAYRFGHSPTRPARLFPQDADSPFGTGDLRGFRPVLPELRVNRHAFFDAAAQAGKLIDTRLSTAMLNLPTGVVPAGTSARNRSLATRNLQRGIDVSLPSGQAVAAPLRIPDPLSAPEIWTSGGAQVGSGHAPLWFYNLREGEFSANGRRLAGAGAAIMARAIIAFLTADKASYLWQDPTWTPTLGRNGRFTASDLAKHALKPAQADELGSEDVTTLPGDDGAGV